MQVRLGQECCCFGCRRLITCKLDFYCVIQIQYMQKANNSPSNNEPYYFTKLQNINQFPNIQYRKLSLHMTEQPKYLIKLNQINNHQRNSQPITYPLAEKERGLEQTGFVMQRESSYLKKRIFVTPNRFSSKQKVHQLLQNDLVRRQIEQQQKKQEGRDQIIFNSSALKELGIIISEDFNGNLLTNTNTKQYQGYRKRNSEKLRDKLKPIISENHLNSGMQGLQFFNINKINLVDIEKSKKSTSLLTKSFGEEKESQHINSIKYTKELNLKNKMCDSKNNSKDRSNTCQKIKVYPQSENSIRTHIFQQEENNKKQTITNSPKQSDDEKKIVLSEKAVSIRRPNKRFNIPFQTYYYRDLIWKVNYSNQQVVEFPIEYEHRLKVFVGKGNNSCMVSGLITRRPWFAFTDKVEEANFVWTQLKQLSFLKKQDVFKGEIGLQQRDKAKYKAQSILTDMDSHSFKNYFRTYFTSEEHNDERLQSRIKHIKYRKVVKASEIEQLKVHNHLINNYVLGNKKALFNTMSNYYKQMKEDVFEYLPLTFHIRDGLEDKKYFEFLKYYHKRSKQISKANQQKGHVKQYNAWIVKPGQNSNRGNGIKMCLTLDQIKAILKKRQRYPDGSYRTFIVQSYIQRPLLYFRRKFDLRHYIMMTSINGIIKGYWYKHGYVRTTSSQYTLSQNTGGIHLTNDAVQKHLPEYGKYQKGNKISYQELSNYIDKYYPNKKRSFQSYIYPKMKKIATDAMRASSGGIDPSKLENNFQIFGMDFMIDANLQVWLIEINTNPCLELSCPLLGCIIPKMVQNALELTLDALFPPPVRFSPKGMHYYKELEKQNKFELVYDQRVEKLYKGSLQVLDSKLLEQEDDTFEDCGEQWEDN